MRKLFISSKKQKFTILKFQLRYDRHEKGQEDENTEVTLCHKQKFEDKTLKPREMRADMARKDRLLRMTQRVNVRLLPESQDLRTRNKLQSWEEVTLRTSQGKNTF